MRWARRQRVRVRGRWPRRGILTVTIIEAGLPRTVVLENTITEAGHTLLAGQLIGAADSPHITWLAWGDDATAPAAGQTALGNETGRKQVTRQSVGASAGEVETEVFLGPTDANGVIEELAFYAGAASATPGSGTMVARVLFSHEKNDQQAIQVVRTDTVGGS